MPTLNELLHAASRTFALGIDLLPRPLRGEVEVAYLLLRVSDYLEDNESMEAALKAELLEAWARALEVPSPDSRLISALEAAEDGTPDALVARHAEAVHQALRGLRPAAREIVGRHVADSTRGMARWALRGPDIGDEADLDDYMHEVAGRVGWLLTELFALDIPAVDRRRASMMALGRDFGLALQTVNVIRGLHADWTRGWVFVPRAFVPASGADPAALFQGRRDRDAERVVLARLVEKAEGHLEAARRYVAGIPARHHGVRLFCLLPYFFAVRTLAVSADNPSVFEEETKIGRADVRRTVIASRWLGWSDAWVAWYARRLRERAPG
ncbi:MAG: squalene/phytoene synthase family protein [Gemmatimonadetes bacterium]|nr:squalene/phytoene synthase family protein [Gemmatimonadota bacterium]